MVARKRKRSDGPVMVTRRELAAMLACSPDRVTKWVAEGMPGVLKTGSGRGHETEIDLKVALPWALQKRAGTKDEEQTRVYKSQADKNEQEIRKRAGELVDVHEVEQGWAGIVSAVRERLLSLPGAALQQGVCSEEGENILIALVDDALSELSRGQRPS